MSPTSNQSSIAPHTLTLKKTHDVYNYDNLKGWGRFRYLRPGWDMYHDIRRRLPYYKSDITDALTYRTVASIVRFLLPALAYTLDMYRRTGEFFGVNEALFSSALAAMSICWATIWAAIFHWLAAIWNMCDYMSYVTEFSSESFGMYVGTIYMIKGVEELVSEFSSRGSIDGYLSCTVAILYFATIYVLEKLGSSSIFKPSFRGFLADYAYPIGTIFCVGFAHIQGRLKDANIGKVPVTKAFHPTQVDRLLGTRRQMDLCLYPLRIFSNVALLL
ncbi:hypothetical protein ACJ73_05674 [Blastomyces percursus]|uniref:Bicarbonate transporter-like transmembrane domain-containing protein n=1 Tax=Blastomyces percursus TaxID=1658174 RepID=A0A1J9Q353_9EURO|nr:hypothetical protein ACJ73_05674 [Blastomyces percursus]